tara:strand:+ start:312 stop:1151 length:840 start_codon:yes stop_codon:yes gene_type:complete
VLNFQKPVILLVALLVGTVSFQATAQQANNIEWHWQDEFSKDEKDKLKTWITLTHQAVEKRIGVYPFTVHYYFYRKVNASEPVPWAHTKRWEGQQVHFHVDTQYELQEFLNDWTAPHEISHLALPFLGKSYSWFAEGFASYMQYQVMEEMGTCTSKEKEKRFEQKFSANLPKYKNNNSVVEQAKKLRKQYDFPGMYWGGASLFYAWNRQLIREKDKNLCSLFSSYLQCCRMKNINASEIVLSLDSIADVKFGKTLLDNYESENGVNTIKSLKQNNFLPN